MLILNCIHSGLWTRMTSCLQALVFLSTTHCDLRMMLFVLPFQCDGPVSLTSAVCTLAHMESED